MLYDPKKLDIIAIIPARGESQRIPRKNLMLLEGKPLIAHTIEHAKNSRYVDTVYVSTEDKEIKEVAKQYGAQVIERPKELATDTATSESALLHVLNSLDEDPDLVVFLQCTSPMRKKDDIDHAIELLLKENADSLFSAARNYGLVWSLHNGNLHSINYDYTTRKREQDMDVQYRENGSLYIFKPEVLRKYNNRLGGKISVYEMDVWSSYQYDKTEDLDHFEFLLKKLNR